MRRPDPHDITILGLAHSRRGDFSFGQKHADRFFHTYIIGKTGTGKSSLIESMALQDIQRGYGIALIDPHGDLATRVADASAKLRPSDTIFLNVPDPAQPYGYNPLRHVHQNHIPLAAAGLLETMRKLWPDAWGVRMEHILRNALYALLEQKDATLADIPRLFTEKQFRKNVAGSLQNQIVRQFWEKEYERYSYGYRADGVASIQNKVGAFLVDPVIHRILTEPETDLRIRQIMDEGKVLIVNLAKGLVGEDGAAVLGGLLVTTIGLAAMSRSNTPESTRRPFFVYIDEFQNFTTLAITTMLSELRKYGIGMVMAHQYLHQLEPEIRHAVLGNTGTLISFRLGGDDAPYIAKEFGGMFTPADLIEMPNFQINLRLMVDGTPTVPFTATTLAPEPSL